MRSARPWLLLAPIPAVLIGAATAHAHGAPPAAFLPNLIALVVGGAGFILLTRTTAESRRPPLWLPVVAFLGIAATLVSPDIAGVHRWLSLGGFRMNASAVLSPWLLVALADGVRERRRLAIGLACAAQVVHLAQPDAAQATALALGMLPLLAGGGVIDRRARIAVWLLLSTLAAAAWTRPDPLPAVAQVERVLVLTVARGPIIAATAVAAALALFAPALLALRSQDQATVRLGAGAALYLAAQLGATFAGRYPVPVFGAGAGPLLGWWLLTAAIFPPRALSKGRAAV